jgi:recombinational DNA repair protein (RecF pathway)
MLDALDETRTNRNNLLFYFEIRLAAILGFRLSFDRCVACGNEIEFHPIGEKPTVQFHLGRGGLLCGKCSSTSGQKISLSEQAVFELRQLNRVESAADVVALDIAKPSGDEIEDLLWTYLRVHVTGIRALRSNRVFSKILASP